MIKLITYENLEKNIASNKIDNSYIICGSDEELVKDSVNKLIKPFVNNDDGLGDLNYANIDGMNTTSDAIINACETMPFMSDKKVVVIKRANFLKDKADSVNSKTYSEIKDYLKDTPDYTLLVMYFILTDKRDTPKKHKKLMGLDKVTTIVHVDKLRRDGYIKKVSEIFNEKNKEIGNVELRYFVDRAPNNFEMIKNEIDKLIAYTDGRAIKKEDIDKLLPNTSEDDIFDLVDLISQRKIEKAIDIMNELLFKSDAHMLIIVSIENQFKKLYDIKVEMQSGKRTEDIMSKFRVPKFVAEKLMNLSNKFSKKQLEKILELCVQCEGRLKSTSLDKTTELELLLINTLTVKK